MLIHNKIIKIDLLHLYYLWILSESTLDYVQIIVCIIVYIIVHLFPKQLFILCYVRWTFWMR